MSEQERMAASRDLEMGLAQMEQMKGSPTAVAQIMIFYGNSIRALVALLHLRRLWRILIMIKS